MLVWALRAEGRRVCGGLEGWGWEVNRSDRPELVLGLAQSDLSTATIQIITLTQQPTRPSRTSDQTSFLRPAMSSSEIKKVLATLQTAIAADDEEVSFTSPGLTSRPRPSDGRADKSRPTTLLVVLGCR